MNRDECSKLSAGDYVLAGRINIATMRVSELSVMPEGLEQMPDADFRNLINYILNASPSEPVKTK